VQRRRNSARVSARPRPQRWLRHTELTRGPAAKARLAYGARFYPDVPCDIPEAERDRRAAAARSTYYAALTARSVAARVSKRPRDALRTGNGPIV
jgi:hypothetical protein